MTGDRLSSWPETGCCRGPSPAALMVVKQALLLASVECWERTDARLKRSSLQAGCVKNLHLGMLPWLREHYLTCCFESGHGPALLERPAGARCSNFEGCCWQGGEAVQRHC